MRLRRWLATAAALLLFVAFAAPTQRTEAHANLVASEPSSGSRVDAMPERLRLEYTEGVQSLEVRVTDSEGAHFETSRAEPDPADQRLRSVLLRDGPPGIYTVSWQALSVDGHTTEGSFFFVVGDSLPDRETLLAQFEDTSQRQDTWPNPLEVIGRSLLYASMLALVGMPVAAALISRELAGSPRAWAVARRVLRLGACALIVGALVLALKQFASAYQWTAADLRAYAGSGQGLAGLSRLLAGAAVLTAVVLVRHPIALLGIVAAAALVGQGSVSAVSHSQTLVGGVTPVLTDFLHLVGAALWGGGLVLLAFVLPRAWPDAASDERRQHTERAGRRFAFVAIVGVGAVVTAGLLLAAWHLGGWHEVVGSLYGGSAVAKTGLLALALILGAWHRLRLVRALESPGADAVRRFTRSVRVEAALLLAILFLSAVMTSAETGTAAATANRGAQVRRTEQVRGIDVRLTMTPGTPGFNVFDVEYVRPGAPVARVESPTLLLRLPAADVELAPIELQPSGGGRYSTVAAITQPGEWFARVSADVDGTFTAGRFTLPESRSGASPYRGDSAFVRSARTAAGAVGALTLLAIAIEVIARRRESLLPRALGPSRGSDQ